MATRYDQKTKDEVVAFIKDFNEENGRGGQSAAAKKWKLNPITVKAWMDKAGIKTPGKTAKKKKKGKATGKPAVRQSPVATKSVSGALKRMVSIQEQIDALQAEYDKLKKSL